MPEKSRAGREQSTAAILDAAESLFAERGFTAVTVRDIAAEAGVSHALVHRYLGSKEQVYRAMLLRRENVIRDAAPIEGGLLEATRLMLREAVLNQRGYVRLIAHSALHGLSYDRTAGRFAATERLVELAGEVAAAEGDGRDPDAPDPRFVIASLVAMLIGWSAAREWILPAAGLPPMGEEEFADAFERIVVDMERMCFPSLRDEAEG
jgi:AcrR family transcriptional regulator